MFYFCSFRGTGTFLSTALQDHTFFRVDNWTADDFQTTVMPIKRGYSFMSKFYSARTATAVIVANMVGTGVFTSLGFQLVDINTVFPILLLWTLGGILLLLRSRASCVLCHAC